VPDRRASRAPAGDAADGALTLQEAADQLGVHYMTAYRYVRLGLLPASKAGGTWRVSSDDLHTFRTGGGTSPVPAGRPAPWSERLEARLVAGDHRGAWGVIEAALAAGAELDEVYLDVLSPALVGIGARWERGEIDIAVEHRATGIANRLIGRLGPRFVRRGRVRGHVVVGAPEGETHSLPTAILADLLRLEGWEVSDLGANTPAASLAHAASTTDDLVAVGLSITLRESADAAAFACASIRAAAPSVPIVLGGSGVVDAAQAQAVGADAYADSAASMARILDSLVARSGAAVTEP
jgi:excisionase family DNA binding protein